MTLQALTDNPQLDITSGYLRGAGNCCACGLPLSLQAEYGVIFTGSWDYPEVVYTAHYEPLPGTADDEEDADGMTRRPCFEHLERTYEAELAKAGILRYRVGDHGYTLTSVGQPADRSGFPTDVSGEGHACSVLLACGQWARGLLSDTGLRVQYSAGTRPEWAGVATALVRPGAPPEHIGEDWPYASALQLGVDGGGPRWYLEGHAMNAGAPLEVYLAGAGWVRARIETSEAGRRAHIYVAVADGRYVILPEDAAVRRVPER